MNETAWPNPQRLRRARPVALLIAGACLLCAFCAAGVASAATVQIGSVAEIGSAALPSAITSGGFGVQLTEAAGTYSVPPGYGTITAWSHSAGGTPGALTFKVYRPTGAPREFLVVGSDTETVTAGSVQTFPVQIPVQPGDRIGLSSDAVELAYETFDLNDQIGFFAADLPVGTTRATDGDPFPDYKLDVAATVTNDVPPGPADAAPAGAPAPPAGSGSAPAPRLTQLSLAPASFAAAHAGSSTRSGSVRGTGARVRIRADRSASVRFSVQRVATGRRSGSGAGARCVAATKRNRTAPRCTRYVSLGGAFTKTAGPSLESFTFTGRVGGRTLAPGSYRLLATATAAGVVGNTVTRTFRIRR
jgi:hypothetical protein